MAESIVFVSGKAGAGKSSCCQYAIKHPEQWALDSPVRHLSVGQRFRDITDGVIPSRLTKETQYWPTRLDHALPPSNLVHQVVEEFVKDLDTPGVTLIDGYPKEFNLLPFVYRSIEEGVMSVSGLVSIVVRDNMAVNRQTTRANAKLSREDALRRVQVYTQDTEPVLNAFAQELGQQRNAVDGEQPFPVVANNFISILSQLAGV
jgi:adenylate kinase family enzyme